ncbi:hypothetical protein AAHW99_15845 [Klebsiella variicola subsp. variicola]|uniref:hypothetical protein n=1 Tax=Klebsiella variicola TaxID=244366 RepID=UPI0035ABDD6D
MGNEIEQIAQQNEMSIEFVTWFFNEKKANCGNVWFMMMAAMWEGWKGRSIEMDKLAAENVALKAGVREAFEEMESHHGTDGLYSYDADGEQMDALIRLCDAQGTISDLLSMVETPATDRIVAEAEARGVEKFIASLPSYADTEVNTYDDGVKAAIETTQTVYGPVFIKQLREGAK